MNPTGIGRPNNSAQRAHTTIMRALRSEGKEPKPEAEKPKEKKPDVPQVREKLHGSGAHSRESKTPKAKQKAVYGKPKN